MPAHTSADLLARYGPAVVLAAAARIQQQRANPAAIETRPRRRADTPDQADLFRHQDKVDEVLAKYGPAEILAAAARVRAPRENVILDSPHAVYSYAIQKWPSLQLHGHEIATAIGLDAGLQPRKTWTVASGASSSAPIDLRQALGPALDPVLPIEVVVFLHGHPTGDPEPSDADRHLTGRLESAAKVLGVTLHDHIIIGDANWFSFRMAGLMQ